MFLDITASHEDRDTIFDVVPGRQRNVLCPSLWAAACGHWRTSVNFYGGADKVSINTTAILNPNFVEEAATKFGSQCIVVSIDAKRVGEHFEILSARRRERNQRGRMG